MAYLAILGYPNPASEPAVECALNSSLHHMQAWWTKQSVRHGLDRSKVPEKLLQVQPRNIGSQLRRLQKRLVTRRFVAAHFARIRLLQVGATLLDLAGTSTLLSLDSFLSRSTVVRDHDGLGNLRRSVWIETKPVLHLALGIWDALEQRGLSWPSFDVLEAIAEWSWISDAIVAAERWRVSCSLLDIDVRAQVRVVSSELSSSPAAKADVMPMQLLIPASPGVSR